MKKYFFTITTILILVLGLLSCSNEETKTQNQLVARPTVPLQDGEIRIGTQVWMTKNLNVSRYRNGDPIPQVIDGTQWDNLTTGAWCYYNNDPATGAIYGKLYNWYAVNDPRGLAPVGCHIPAETEWSALVTFLGGESVAGGKMKANSLWLNLNTGTNSSGFTGLPGGYRINLGQFNWMTGYTYWWSASSEKNPTASYRMLFFDNDDIAMYTNSEDFGFSVRCIKD